MRTLIRIKRRLGEEPVENIVVKPKRLRICQIEGAAAADPNIPASVLKRVATVESKEEQLGVEVLKTAEKRYLEGCEVQLLYKRQRKSGFEDLIKHETKDRTSYNRYMVRASHQGDIVGVDLGKEKGVEAKEGKHKKTTADGDKKKDSQKSENVGKVDDSSLVSTADEVKYLDAELNHKADDVITCNGKPMESEKYVYDIYYSPTSTNWADYVCDVQKYMYDSTDDTCVNFGDYEDDDDENAEDNWRNDYPDEEDDDEFFEDEDEYLNRSLLKSRSQYYDTDESFDVDEYEEEAFDDEGNLIPQDYNNQILRLRKYVASITLKSDSEDD